MKVAIVGLPMSGKTSLFRVLTGGGADAAVHTGRAALRQTKVMDSRLDRLAEDYKPKKITHAVIDFMDFPPITRPGGAERTSCADLLAPAREAGALMIVVRAFESASLPPLRGKIDPAEELAEVLEELRLADLEIASGRLERIAASLKKKRGDDLKSLAEEQVVVEKVVAHLEGGGEVHELELTPTEQKSIRGFQFLSQKPRVIVENTSDGRAKATIPEAIAVPVAIELELSELDPESRELFQEEYGITEFSSDVVNATIYRRAGLISYLTAGEPEVRAWTIPENTSAVEAAEVIHSDISRGFIRAEIVSYDDYINDGGHGGAKEKGHLRLEGKEYIVQDGDIILFRFNV